MDVVHYLLKKYPQSNYTIYMKESAIHLHVRLCNLLLSKSTVYDWDSIVTNFLLEWRIPPVCESDTFRFKNMIQFFGRHIDKQSMLKKLVKYGSNIKLYALVDECMDGYVSWKDVYVLFAAHPNNIFNIDLIPFFIERGVPFDQSMDSILLYAVMYSEDRRKKNDDRIFLDLCNVLEYLKNRGLILL